MKLIRPRALLVLLSTLVLLGGALTVSVSAQPAFAAGCHFPSNAEVHSKQWYLNKASSTVTINWTVGRELSGSEFIDILNGGTQNFRADYPEAQVQGWFRTNGDYGLPVNLQNNGCKGVVVVQTGTDSHLWTDICVAPSAGQDHSVCNWDLPENLRGHMYAGLLNPSTHEVGTNPGGTLMST
jgi:hypothetical protein